MKPMLVWIAACAVTGLLCWLDKSGLTLKFAGVLWTSACIIVGVLYVLAKIRIVP